MKINKSRLISAGTFVFRHWFGIACGLFVGYMCFFGQYSVVNILSLRSQERGLRHDKRVYQDSLDHFTKRLAELQTDNVQLEKIARERMLMHKENEDLYLVDE